MDLFTQITDAYPELTNEDFYPVSGSILLRDDETASNTSPNGNTQSHYLLA
jgi:hypothetical protein